LEFVEESIAKKPGLWLAEVLLATDMERARQLIPPATALLAEDEQGVRLSCYISDLDDFARFLVRLDCPLVVLSPPELRQALQRLAALAAQLADGVGPTSPR
jgi:hypothetical protein